LKELKENEYTHSQPQDFPAICSLMKNELGYPELNETEAVKRLEFFRKSEDFETFVADTNGFIAGFIGVMKSVAYNYDGYYSQIMALAVSENARRKGIGTALVKKTEEWTLSFGIKGIGVNSGLHRLNTHTFYEINGYIKKSYSFTKEL
jgi:GNAT superfamily N-acetyltransferase